MTLKREFKYTARESHTPPATSGNTTASWSLPFKIMVSHRNLQSRATLGKGVGESLGGWDDYIKSVKDSRGSTEWWGVLAPPRGQWLCQRAVKDVCPLLRFLALLLNSVSNVRYKVIEVTKTRKEMEHLGGIAGQQTLNTLDIISFTF